MSRIQVFVITIAIVSGSCCPFWRIGHASEPWQLQTPSNSDDQTSTHPVRSPLVVGTKISPPFSFKRPDGTWTGISIELWNSIADEMDVETEYRELELKEFFNQLQSGEIDAAIAAISVTTERDRRVAFSHAYHSTGLGVAVPLKKTGGPWGFMRGLLTARFFEILAAILLLAVVAGIVFWGLERKKNEGMFGGRKSTGVSMGMWWATIILLGHKGVIPATAMGRMFAAIVMIVSTIAVSLLTAVIASAMTVANLGHPIGHPDDLRHLRTATVESSTSAEYLVERHVRHRRFEALDEALQSLADGDVDAVVYDLAMLKYRSNSDFAAKIEVLPLTFNAQQYAIAMQPNSEIRKSVNQALLKITSGDAWPDVLYRYLGE